MTRMSASARIVALAACGGFLAAVPAHADPVEMPTRKAGLWEIKMTMAGGRLPAQTIQQCTDATTDKDMNTAFGPMSKEACSKQDMHKTATGMVIESTCNIGGVPSTSHIEVNGDFNSAYTIQVSSSRDGGPAGVPRDTSMTMEAKWVGACKPDQKAGDMVMPGGVKMNIRDLHHLKAMAPKH